MADPVAYVTARIAPPNERGCMLWLGTVGPGGYPFAKVAGKNVYAHRLQWELVHGPLAKGMCVCHHCDTPLCMNVAHHFIGTVGDNNRDRSAKGRTARQFNERHGMVKFTNEQIEAMRLRRLSGETLASIASSFGASKSHICNVVRGRKRPVGA